MALRGPAGMLGTIDSAQAQPAIDRIRPAQESAAL
jgi:hypothetical protein